MRKSKQGKRPASQQLLTVQISDKAVSWSFRFENSDICSDTSAQCEFLIIFPPHLGGVRRRAQLCGSWTALIEPDGDLVITDLNAEVSSFQLPLLDPKTKEIHWMDSGRLEVTLKDIYIEKALATKLGQPNTGHVDFETGVARVNWSFYIHSPQLAALDIDPIPVFVSEVGFLDRETSDIYLAGGGLITSGLFRGVFLLCGNPAKATCTLAVRIPQPVSRTTPNTVTVSYTETPPSLTPVTITLGGTVFGGGAGTPATIAPGTVTITAPGTATATLTIPVGTRLNASVRVDATGNGQSAFDGAKVGP